MADILIEGGTIVTVDPDRRVIKDGGIVISGDRIEAVGKIDEIKRQYSADRVIDAKGKVVFPGFVNTHTHLWQMLLKGLGDDRVLIDWGNEMTWRSGPYYEKEDKYVAALLGCIEAIKSGTTCTADFDYPHPRPKLADPIIKAFQETGIRGVYIRGIIDWGEEYGLPPELIENLDDALNDCERVFKEYNGSANGRIHVWFGIDTIFHATRECYEGVRALANKLKTRISAHVSESPTYIESAIKRFGMRDLEFMDHIGFTGPDLLAVHCVLMTNRDIRILKGRDIKVSHNPTANMYLSSGVAPIPRMIESGITVGLGVDGAASNNNQDMVQLLKITALLHKVHHAGDPTIITCEKVLEMATIDGARALGLENEIGSIEPGKKADLVIMNFKKPATVPYHHPVSTLVYSATSENVDTTIIDGKIVMENREIKTVNEVEVMEKAMKVANSIVERVGLEHLRDRPWRSLAF